MTARTYLAKLGGIFWAGVCEGCEKPTDTPAAAILAIVLVRVVFFVIYIKLAIYFIREALK